jgi:hypothetical protein
MSDFKAKYQNIKNAKKSLEQISSIKTEIVEEPKKPQNSNLFKNLKKKMEEKKFTFSENQRQELVKSDIPPRESSPEVVFHDEQDYSVITNPVPERSTKPKVSLKDFSSQKQDVQTKPELKPVKPATEQPKILSKIRSNVRHIEIKEDPIVSSNLQQLQNNIQQSSKPTPKIIRRNTEILTQAPVANINNNSMIMNRSQPPTPTKSSQKVVINNNATQPQKQPQTNNQPQEQKTLHQLQQQAQQDYRRRQSLSLASQSLSVPVPPQPVVSIPQVKNRIIESRMLKDVSKTHPLSIDAIVNIVNNNNVKKKSESEIKAQKAKEEIELQIQKLQSQLTNFQGHTEVDVESEELAHDSVQDSVQESVENDRESVKDHESVKDQDSDTEHEDQESMPELVPQEKDQVEDEENVDDQDQDQEDDQEHDDTFVDLESIKDPDFIIYKINKLKELENLFNIALSFDPNDKSKQSEENYLNDEEEEAILKQIADIHFYMKMAKYKNVYAKCVELLDINTNDKNEYVSYSIYKNAHIYNLYRFYIWYILGVSSFHCKHYKNAFIGIYNFINYAPKQFYDSKFEEIETILNLCREQKVNFNAKLENVEFNGIVILKHDFGSPATLPDNFDIRALTYCAYSRRFGVNNMNVLPVSISENYKFKTYGNDTISVITNSEPITAGASVPEKQANIINSVVYVHQSLIAIYDNFIELLYDLGEKNAIYDEERIYATLHWKY